MPFGRSIVGSRHGCDENRSRRGVDHGSSGDAQAVELSDESRGKVIVRDITVLFQFKQLISEPTRPVLPSDAKGSLLQNIDAQFAGIFVLVAIFQISLVTYARSLPYIEPSSIDRTALSNRARNRRTK